MSQVHEVPEDVATCPECGSKLNLEIVEWETGTGVPTENGCEVSCSWEDKEFSK